MSRFCICDLESIAIWERVSHYLFLFFLGVRVDLVEGKYQPKDLGKLAFNINSGSTSVIFLRLTRPIWGISEGIDDGFVTFFLWEIIELTKLGCFVAELIKKEILAKE